MSYVKDNNNESIQIKSPFYLHINEIKRINAQNDLKNCIISVVCCHLASIENFGYQNTYPVRTFEFELSCIFNLHP